MNKNKYEIPTAEMICFEAADILTSSSDPFDGEWVPIGRSADDYAW